MTSSFDVSNYFNEEGIKEVYNVLTKRGFKEDEVRAIMKKFETDTPDIDSLVVTLIEVLAKRYQENNELCDKNLDMYKVLVYGTLGNRFSKTYAKTIEEGMNK